MELDGAPSPVSCPVVERRRARRTRHRHRSLSHVRSSGDVVVSRNSGCLLVGVRARTVGVKEQAGTRPQHLQAFTPLSVSACKSRSTRRFCAGRRHRWWEGSGGASSERPPMPACAKTSRRWRTRRHDAPMPRFMHCAANCLRLAIASGRLPKVSDVGGAPRAIRRQPELQLKSIQQLGPACVSLACPGLSFCTKDLPD